MNLLIRSICFGLPLIAVAMYAVSSKPANPKAPTEKMEMSEESARIFDRACRDCHSNETEWPWYSRVPPFSFAVEDDVQRARASLNLSEWQTYSRGRKLGLLAAIPAVINAGRMPPAAYRFMHRESQLSSEERSHLIQWATQERARLHSEMPR